MRAHQWHELMKSTCQQMGDDTRLELRHWEKENMDGRHEVAEWPGWKELIGNPPWADQIGYFRRVKLGMLIEAGQFVRVEQADGFYSALAIDTYKSSGSRTVREQKEEKRWIIFERDDFRCLLCGSRRRLTIDHIVPRYQGGGDGMCNWQTLCRKCNSRKGIR